MASQPEDTKTPSTTGTQATPPRKESAVAPEATAQAARQTARETAPAAPAAPAPAKAPAKTSGPTPESKRKAARATTASTRRGRARTASKATTAAPRARAAATRAAAVRAGTERPRLVPPAAAALPAPTPEPGERAGHAFGRLNADIVAASRDAGRTVVEAVEGAGDRIAAYHETVARTATLPWIADIARANAGITRAATRAYAGTARTLLKD